MKKLIVFDLDGTLAESKSALDAEMSALLAALLEVAKVAVISGGDWPQFEKQLVSNLPQGQPHGKSSAPSDLRNQVLAILPGNGNGSTPKNSRRTKREHHRLR